MIRGGVPSTTVALALLSILAATPSSNEPAPRAAQPQAQEAKLHQGGAENAPGPGARPIQSGTREVAYAAPDRPEAAPDAPGQPQETAQPLDAAQWWFNFFLVVLTAGLVVVGAAQVCLLFRSLAVSRNAAKAAADSVAVAESSVAVSKLALLSDRPYLLTQSAAMPGSPAMTPRGEPIWDHIQFIARPRFEVKIKNFGKGPALLKRIMATLDIHEGVRGAEEYSSFWIDHTAAVTADAFVPGDEFTVPVFSKYILGVDDRQLKCLENGELYIVAFGALIYEDVFRNEYTTTFCWMFGAPGYWMLEGRKIWFPLSAHKGPDHLNVRS